MEIKKKYIFQNMHLEGKEEIQTEWDRVTGRWREIIHYSETESREKKKIDGKIERGREGRGAREREGEGG